MANDSEKSNAPREASEVIVNNVKGGLWILNAALMFSIVSVIIKLLGADYSVMQILFIRQTIMGLLAAPLIIRTFPDGLKTRKAGLHVVRNIAALCAMGFGFTAVAHLPLAQVTAISFARAFFITIFAIIILHEVVGMHRWGATIVGFMGVLVTMGPMHGGLDVYAIYAVVSAAAAGLVMNVIRLLSRTDRPSTILIYQVLFIGIVAAPFAWLSWKTPDFNDWLLFLGLGVFSILGQMSNIHGFRIGEASAIVQFDYAKLIFASIFGYIVFSETPGLGVWVGSAMIVAAALYTWNRNRRYDKVKVRPEYGTAPRP